MLRTTVLMFAISIPGAAFACSGHDDMASTSPTAAKTTVAQADATRCAKKASLVGENCSYSTGKMAQRVNTEGKDTTLTSVHFEKHDAMLDSHVAVPYKVADMYVIANEVVEQIADPTASMALSGKVLEVDGVKYLLVTSFKKASA
jgi:hypothetical protein